MAPRDDDHAVAAFEAVIVAHMVTVANGHTAQQRTGVSYRLEIDGQFLRSAQMYVSVVQGVRSGQARRRASGPTHPRRPPGYPSG